MAKTKRQTTIFTVYDIETGKEHTFTNFNEWARSVGENVNTRTRFNEMCKSTTQQYRGKYILKDEKFNERLENAKTGKIKERSAEMKEQASLNQRKDYHKNKVFVEVDDSFNIMNEYNTNDILNLKKFAEDNKMNPTSFLLMLRNGVDCLRINHCGKFMLKSTYENELKEKLLIDKILKKEKVIEIPKKKNEKPELAQVRQRDEILNLFKLTNITTGKTLLTKNYNINQIAEIYDSNYTTMITFLKSSIAKKTVNKKGETIIKEKIEI